MKVVWQSRNIKNLWCKKLVFVQKNGLSNLSEFLMKLIEALIIDEFFSKLNFQFLNNKISIKSSSLTFKMLLSIISTVFKSCTIVSVMVAVQEKIFCLFHFKAVRT